MSEMTSNKPYLIRAMYDWIIDNGYTPYLLVTVEHGGVEAPIELAKNGKIIFNVSPNACRGVNFGNDMIVFSARFSGEVMQICVVPQAVLAIYAQENAKGMEFPEESGTYAWPETVQNKSRKKPILSLVTKTAESAE